jgi:hypothetical protein
MEANLATTNNLLGIMAAVSVLEALVLIGTGVAVFIAYRRVMALVNGLEARYVEPAMTKVNVILEDVHTVAAKVREETERVDHAVNQTIDRVDDTVDRVRSSVWAKTNRIIGFIRGIRAVVEGMLQSQPRYERAAGPARRVM